MVLAANDQSCSVVATANRFKRDVAADRMRWLSRTHKVFERENARLLLLELTPRITTYNFAQLRLSSYDDVHVLVRCSFARQTLVVDARARALSSASNVHTRHMAGGSAHERHRSMSASSELIQSITFGSIRRPRRQPLTVGDRNTSNCICTSTIFARATITLATRTPPQKATSAANAVMNRVTISTAAQPSSYC